MRGRPKGQPKTGGREKGTPNKASTKREAEIKASGLTPLDFMLKVLRDESAPDEDRQWAAQSAAPYVHPRLSAVAHADNIADLIRNLSDGEIARRRKGLEEAIAEQTGPGADPGADPPIIH